MAYRIVKKITPNPQPADPYADIDAWKEVNGPYHGTQSPAVGNVTWTLDSDGYSAIVSQDYDTKEVCDRHQLTEPEDYSDEYDVEIVSQGEV